jgi:hypothetical protein
MSRHSVKKATKRKTPYPGPKVTGFAGYENGSTASSSDGGVGISSYTEYGDYAGGNNWEGYAQGFGQGASYSVMAPAFGRANFLADRACVNMYVVY